MRNLVAVVLGGLRFGVLKVALGGSYWMSISLSLIFGVCVCVARSPGLQHAHTLMYRLGVKEGQSAHQFSLSHVHLCDVDFHRVYEGGLASIINTVPVDARPGSGCSQACEHGCISFYHCKVLR